MASQAQEVDETIKTLQSHRGVKGIIVLNYDGIPIRSTFTDAKVVVQYAALVTFLTIKAQSFMKKLDGNPLETMRVRSNKHELLIAPGSSYILVVVQEPDATFGSIAIGSEAAAQ
eukprot:TRINITY_DN2688_c0_g1_i1.p2 TRINITY_DN2688_c0_g1~~TRINITY_DN2688_c0_g1_i1.p2  ORF type:complete len:115 (-),score=10.28 TRINITY_DN2688_c0_g1_i1:590-934(-)